MPPGDAAFSISGTELRERLAEGRDLPVWFTPPEIAAELRRACPPDAMARDGSFGSVRDGAFGSVRDGASGRCDGAGAGPDPAAPGTLAGLRPPSLEPERHGG